VTESPGPAPMTDYQRAHIEQRLHEAWNARTPLSGLATAVLCQDQAVLLAEIRRLQEENRLLRHTVASYEAGDEELLDLQGWGHE